MRHIDFDSQRIYQDLLCSIMLNKNKKEKKEIYVKKILTRKISNYSIKKTITFLYKFYYNLLYFV
jgi:hypothetical protein